MNKNYTGLELVTYQNNRLEVVSFIEAFNMYQCKEVNSNGIITSPLYSVDDLEKLINTQTKLTNQMNKINKLQQIEKEKQAKQKESESIGNYLIDKPLQHAKVKKVLNVIENFNGEHMTRKDKVKLLLESGYTLRIIDKMVTNTRKINLEKVNTYKNNVPVMEDENGFYVITKTEYNYAMYLQNELLEVV